MGTEGGNGQGQKKENKMGTGGGNGQGQKKENKMGTEGGNGQGQKKGETATENSNNKTDREETCSYLLLVYGPVYFLALF